MFADFHCDLLSFLSHDSARTPLDAAARCSLPQLSEGKVALQIMAIFSKTEKGSAQQGELQEKIFHEMQKEYPQFFEKKMRAMIAIENAAAFCSEEENLLVGLKRLKVWQNKSPIAYISMTWNEENRFGGGAHTDVGLKEDGRTLLSEMAGIAIDLSHTSDRLAYDIINHNDKKNLPLRIVASHSNFRKVSDESRNLPDDLAREIAHRGGLIGLNFVRRFLGNNGITDVLKQIAHAEAIGVQDCLCLGTDFFDDRLVGKELEHLKPFFHAEFDNSSCFPKIRELLSTRLSKEQVDRLCYQNLAEFLA
ncbi:MAG: membrane dipeptidase [Verrucomicrobia bacterium]|nr:membrane dipeptidase [Verrucomicrobiota bacterium]